MSVFLVKHPLLLFLGLRCLVLLLDEFFFLGVDEDDKDALAMFVTVVEADAVATLAPLLLQTSCILASGLGTIETLLDPDPIRVDCFFALGEGLLEVLLLVVLRFFIFGGTLVAICATCCCCCG